MHTLCQFWDRNLARLCPSEQRVRSALTREGVMSERSLLLIGSNYDGEKRPLSFGPPLEGMAKLA